jgi:hypoxanthine phosphoribosyltransferase
MVEYFIPSWDDIEDSIFNVSEKIIKDYNPDVIVAILTGGVIPAKLISDIIGIKNIKYIEIKFYKEVGKTQPKPTLKAIYVDDLENKNVLIVDDVSDTGETLSAVSRVIELFNPQNIRSATIYVKPWSKKYPDYYDKVVDKWIVFPWDKWEAVREQNEIPVKNKDRFLKSFIRK